MMESLSSEIAIDLGTANVLVYMKNRGVILNEPSVIAMISDKGSMKPYAFGYDAKMMLGRTPQNIKVIRPLKDGVIADFKASEEMLKYFIKKASKNKLLLRNSKIIVCVPSCSTPVERRAIQEAAENSGSNDVFLIEEPMAAAIGAGLPVTDPVGSMIVDLGGGTTEVAVLSLGGVVYSNSVRIGGDKMDDAIIAYIRRHFNLFIGYQTAENIKKTIGSAYVNDESSVKKMNIRGRDLILGIPKEIELTEKQIAESLKDSISQIIEAIKIALEAVPPELASDIVSRGIYMTGGGSMISNLDYVIGDAVKLPVILSKNPLESVALGTGKVLDNFKLLSQVLFKQE
ncbi:MAG: rod shape-determining protein [Rickettsia sp.]|nr:rod shape-determining protein [Rickettsia sp.]